MKTEDICTNLTTSIAQVVFSNIEMLRRLWPLKALEGVFFRRGLKRCFTLRILYFLACILITLAAIRRL